MDPFANLRTALVHHWLVTRRGGEQVLEALATLFPAADIYTLVSGAPDLLPALKGRQIRSSILQKLPWPTRWYPYYLPLFPSATERLNLTGYQLVISSDAATVKGVRTDPGAVHICYCHTPMRYVWTGCETYDAAAGPVARLALSAIRGSLRRWDYEAAQRVSLFVANSRNVQSRIADCYHRKSVVIYPPVDIDLFAMEPAGDSVEDFFLLACQLVPYKRVDIVIDAFNQCGRKLLVIGQGSESQKLQRRAKPNIRFLGAQPQSTVVEAMRRCRAFVFAGEEDFGIVMAEAHACGKPVIAFGRGGASEIVQHGATGLLFEEQTVDCLLDAIEQFDRMSFDRSRIRASAVRFGRKRFLQVFSSLCQEQVGGRSACNLAGEPARKTEGCSVLAAGSDESKGYLIA